MFLYLDIPQILEIPTRSAAGRNSESENRQSDSVSFTPQIQPTNPEESIQPINITLPGGAIDFAGEAAKREGAPLRVTFFLHKDSSLFPSNQTVDMVREHICL